MERGCVGTKAKENKIHGKGDAVKSKSVKRKVKPKSETGIFAADLQFAQALVCPVNCVGVMGKGLAKEFRRRYPELSKKYFDCCGDGGMLIGRCVEMFNSDGRWIVWFPTKKHWRDASRLQWIKSGLDDLVEIIQSWKIKSIAIPALGCGEGGLAFADVRQLVHKFVIKLHKDRNCQCRVVLYAPDGTISDVL